MKLSSTWRWAITLFDTLLPPVVLAAEPAREVRLSLGRFLPLPEATPSTAASPSAQEPAGARDERCGMARANGLYLSEYERTVSRPSIARAIAEERIRIAEREDRPIADEPGIVWRPRPVLKRAG